MGLVADAAAVIERPVQLGRTAWRHWLEIGSGEVVEVVVLAGYYGGRGGGGAEQKLRRTGAAACAGRVAVAAVAAGREWVQVSTMKKQARACGTSGLAAEQGQKEEQE